MSDDSDEQRQCRRGVGVHELDAAMALADLAGVSPEPQKLHPQPATRAAAAEREEDEELASTGLSLELGKVGIHSSSPCSSTSSAGHHRHHPAQQQQVQAPVSVYGPRPRHNMLTEAEKEAKRLRRVLANRESARQTILRRQAIRDELARKVADLSSQNESMKKEKDMVMQEYLSLKEENKQLKEQVARTTKKAPAAAPPSQHAVAPSAASPQTTPPQPSFLSTVAPPTVLVPYVWGSWPPTTGHEHAGSPLAPAPLRLAPCAWYYPAAAVEPTSGGGSPAGAETADEDTDDDPCSLTLAIDLDKRSAPIAIGSSRAAEAGQQVGTERDKAVTTAEARKRRKELTKLKHMHATAGRPGGEQW